MIDRNILVAPAFAVATGDPLAITVSATLVGGLLVWSLIRNVASLDKSLDELKGRVKDLESSQSATNTKLAHLDGRTKR